MWAIIVLVYLLIIIYDVNPLIRKQGNSRVIVFYLITIFISFFMNILLSLNVNIPSVVEVIDSISKYIK